MATGKSVAKKLKLKQIPPFGPASAHISNLTAQPTGSAVALEVDGRMSIAVLTTPYTIHVVMASYTIPQGALVIEGETCTTILPFGLLVSAPFSLKLVQTNAASGKYRLDAMVIGQDADGNTDVLDSREITYTV